MLSLVMLMAEWVKVEPWPPGFLDNCGEVELAARYSQLTGDQNYKSISPKVSRDIVENNRLNPIAWKLMIDAHLNANSGPQLLAAVDTISRKNLTLKSFHQFYQCQSYAINVIRDKFEFSKASFGANSWDDIRRKIPSFQGGGFNSQDMFENRDVCLSFIINYATGGEPDLKEIANKARTKYPEYPFEFYYAVALNQYSYKQDEKGKLHPKTTGDPAKYLEQIQYMQRKWPARPAPYYLLMQAYRTSNLKLSKQYASKYLDLETQTFRINWKNQAKEILQSR